MKAWPWGLAGCTALVFGLAGSAAAAPGAPAFQPHAVASWGSGNSGTLGNGTTTGRTLYGDVTGLPNNVMQISAGYRHILALLPDGTVRAWGDNQVGQLGDGSTTNRSTPVQVTGLTGVTQVSAGLLHSLALRSDGTVWAWGVNDFGQAGTGSTGPDQLVPVRVTGLTGVIKISAGDDFSLALRSDGTVWAWGAGRRGQLGNGTTTDSPVPVRVTGLSQVTNISAGGEASVATRTNGISALTSVWTWGDNRAGELGDGTLTRHTTPEQVTGIGTLYIAGIVAGPLYTAVLGTDGSVWAWGDDQFGQLGNAPATPR